MKEFVIRIDVTVEARDYDHAEKKAEKINDLIKADFVETVDIWEANK